MKRTTFFEAITGALLMEIFTVLFIANVSAENLLLEAPGFQAAKIVSTQAAGNAFPADEAGMSAYVKVTQTINIETIKSVFSQVEKVGDNYIVGIVTISNFGGTVGVHLYADTDGWLVAYLKKDEPAAKIMQWLPADVNNPQISTVPRNTLTDALSEVGNKAGVAFLPQIKYYNFKFPDATTMTIFVKTRGTNGTSLEQVEIPENYTLYEASYYHYAFDVASSQLKVDGTLVSNAPSVDRNWWIATDFYKGAIAVGKLLTIEISYTFYDTWDHKDGGSAGVATVLIYKTGG